jgi:N-methylhydantoinase A
VTDADLLVGRIGASTRLGEGLALDPGAARRAAGSLAESTGLGVEGLAAGIVSVVEAHMERAVRRVSVEQGVDPRASTLVAFGGAGGLHATALARRLDMAGVVVPPHAGVFSALGLLLAPPRTDVARSVLLRDGAELDGQVAQVVADAAGSLGVGDDRVGVQVDVRYLGQSHETTVPYRIGDGWAALAASFHEAHARRNGFARPADPIEVVTVRAEATGEPAARWTDLPAPRAEGDAARGTRSVLSPAGEVDATVWWRPGLRPGDEVVGPAVIEESEATTYLSAGERAIVHPTGALEISW